MWGCCVAINSQKKCSCRTKGLNISNPNEANKTKKKNIFRIVTGLTNHKNLKPNGMLISFQLSTPKNYVK